MNLAQLAAALRSRSAAALAELLDAHGDRLFGYRRRPSRNPANAHGALVAVSAQNGRQVDGEWLEMGGGHDVDLVPVPGLGTAEVLLDRLLEHAAGCPDCGPHLLRGSWFPNGPESTEPAASAGEGPSAMDGASAPPVRRRRLRWHRVAAAAVCAAAIAVAALAGFRVHSSATASGGPAATAASGPGSAAPQLSPAATVPVKPGRAAGTPSAHGPGRHTATARSRRPAVVHFRPGAMAPSRPARRSGLRITASPPAPTGTLGRTGNLAVRPGQLNLGSHSAGPLARGRRLRTPLGAACPRPRHHFLVPAAPVPATRPR